MTDAGGIDLQVLGVGSDGQVGFNEPTSSFASRGVRVCTSKHTLEELVNFRFG